MGSLIPAQSAGIRAAYEDRKVADLCRFSPYYIGGCVMKLRSILLGVCCCLGATSRGMADLASMLSIPGEATDLAVGGPGAIPNRLGGFGSDLFYDRFQNVYYGVNDRSLSPLNPYHTRVQQFTLDVNPVTGQADNFQLQQTIFFKTADGSQHFNGQSPANLNGSGVSLGLSFDPEGFVVAPNGRWFVSDEYGPSVYEFEPVKIGNVTEARFVRALTAPSNLIPNDATGQNFDAEFSNPTTTVVSGRQEGRGFESLAISPSGDTLFALLQSPLQQEGASNQGRRSRNVRLVAYDVATGASKAQYIYQVESITDINALIPDDCPVPPFTAANCADFAATQQGRNIAPSALVALNEHEFLVLERDNRGIGTGNPSNEDTILSHVGIKSIFKIDINGATDVTNVSLAGTNALPAGVTPVAKSLYLDLHSELKQAGLLTPEKFEGLAIGPQLASGEFALITITDNDNTAVEISNPANPLAPLWLDVYSNGASSRYTPINDTSRSYALPNFEDPTTNPNLGALPSEFRKIPTFIYSFPTEIVPEPASITPVIIALAALLGGRKRGR